MSIKEREKELLMKVVSAIQNICKNLDYSPDEKEEAIVDKLEELEEKHPDLAILSHDETCDDETCVVKIRANLAGAAYNLKILCLETEQKIIVSVWKLLHSFVLE